MNQNVKSTGIFFPFFVALLEKVNFTMKHLLTKPYRLLSQSVMPELGGQYLADQLTLFQPERADYPHHLLQGVPTQTFILHFPLAGRNMQASFGLKVIWES